MKALEIADAYADACFDQALNGRTEDPIPEKKRDELAAELRRFAAVEAERDALKSENERLTNCLKKANDQAEDFERRWYLADMELERIKALPHIAWWASAYSGVLLRETISDDLKALTWAGKPMWQPLIALGSKTA